MELAGVYAHRAHTSLPKIAFMYILSIIPANARGLSRTQVSRPGANFIELLKHRICLSTKKLAYFTHVTGQNSMPRTLLVTGI